MTHEKRCVIIPLWTQREVLYLGGLSGAVVVRLVDDVVDDHFGDLPRHLLLSLEFKDHSKINYLHSLIAGQLSERGHVQQIILVVLQTSFLTSFELP